MDDSFVTGDLVIYSSHKGRAEIGVVKRVDCNGAFVAYSLGDTCAKTPFSMLTKVSNDYATKGLVTRMEQLGRKLDGLCEDCENWSEE